MKNTDVIKLRCNLPLFGGFYESHFNYSDHNIENDIGWYNQENSSNYTYDDFNWDYDEYYPRMAKGITTAVEEILNDNGFNINFEFIRITSHPSAFIEVETKITFETLQNVIDFLKDDLESFSEFLNEKHGSTGKFSPVTSVDTQEWFNYYLKPEYGQFEIRFIDCLNYILKYLEVEEAVIMDMSYVTDEFYVHFELIKK